MTEATAAPATRAPAAPRAPRRREGRLRRAVRVGASLLLLLVAAAAMGLSLALLAMRHELKARYDRDARPCPTCRAPALLDGRALVDEQGHRLLFATPEEAARYAAGYAEP